MNSLFVGAALSGIVAPGALAGISTIGPFSGDLHEPLNQPGTAIVAQLPIFGGAAALQSYNGTSTAIHLLAADSLGGDMVNPRTGGRILGFTQGPGHFIFTTPVRKLGGYFNNNSGADNATIQFFDAADILLGTQIATVPAAGTAWVWNGWQSDADISKITVTGNGLINGFIWFEDMELSYVPAPTAPAVLGAGCLVAMRRRRAPGS